VLIDNSAEGIATCPTRGRRFVRCVCSTFGARVYDSVHSRVDPQCYAFYNTIAVQLRGPSLQPGDMTIVDNHRVLHGRNQFQRELIMAPYTHCHLPLEGGYAGKDEIDSSRRAYLRKHCELAPQAYSRKQREQASRGAIATRVQRYTAVPYLSSGNA
jgi:hypothetical protein